MYRISDVPNKVVPVVVMHVLGKYMTVEYLDPESIAQFGSLSTLSRCDCGMVTVVK